MMWLALACWPDCLFNLCLLPRLFLFVPYLLSYGVFVEEHPTPCRAFAPLNALPQLVLAESPDKISVSGSKSASKNKNKRKREGAYILFTDLEPDTLRVHIGRADGR
jgi:hypothetical protein